MMYKLEKSYYKKSFFIALILGMCIFVPFLIMDSGIFVYYGDFNAQQIPFYKLGHELVKSGQIFWDWKTDIGTNFIGSYSFYMIGSPFFWLTLLFPNFMLPYLMAPLLILKLALSSLFAFMYIRRFITRPDFAVIGGLLYAFSGFSVYNIFFNHFHEPMVFFPLLLIALEETVVNKRKGFFAIMVTLTSIVNYYFMVSSGVFIIIYFCVRCFSSDFKVDLKTCVIILFEGIIGLLMSAVLLFPSILTVLSVPRTDNIIMGWDIVFYNPVQRYGAIIKNFFLPPDIPARQVFFPQSNAKWASVAAYLPLFSMAGVIAFIKFVKNHFAKKLFLILALCMFIPGLNSMFMAFNSTFYTRWYYIPVLIMCLMTSYVLEHSEINLIYGIKWCGFAVALTSLIGFLPSMESVTVTNSDSVTSESTSSTKEVMAIGALPSNKLYFWLTIVFAFLNILFLIWLNNKRKEKNSKRKFKDTAFLLTAVFCVVCTFFTMIYGRILGPWANDYAKTMNTEIDLEDDEFYRIESLTEMNNINMFWDEYGFRSFHSIVPKSTFDFYKNIGFDRSVNTDIGTNYYALRSLLGVKYEIQKAKSNTDGSIPVFDEMKGFEYLETIGGFDVFENTNFIPMGVAYEYYVDEEQISITMNAIRDRLMVKGAYLSNEQIEKFSDILLPLSNEDRIANSYEKFVEDAENLRFNNVDEFKVLKNGFYAKTSYDSDKLVMFSIPYDEGWSAKINGKPTEIENINGGLIAVRVPAGNNEIKFNYVTPGFFVGLTITLISFVIFVMYMVFILIARKKYGMLKPDKYQHYLHLDQISGVKAHESYIKLLNKKIYETPESDVVETKIDWPETESKEFFKKVKFKNDNIVSNEAFLIADEIKRKKDNE